MTVSSRTRSFAPYPEVRVGGQEWPYGTEEKVLLGTKGQVLLPQESNFNSDSTVNGSVDYSLQICSGRVSGPITYYLSQPWNFEMNREMC